MAPSNSSSHAHLGMSLPPRTTTLSHLETIHIYLRGDLSRSHPTDENPSHARYPHDSHEACNKHHTPHHHVTNPQTTTRHSTSDIGSTACSTIDAAPYYDPTQAFWVDQNDDTPPSQAVLTTIINWLQDDDDLDTCVSPSNLLIS